MLLSNKYGNRQKVHYIKNNNINRYIPNTIYNRNNITNQQYYNNYVTSNNSNQIINYLIHSYPYYQYNIQSLNVPINYIYNYSFNNIDSNYNYGNNYSNITYNNFQYGIPRNYKKLSYMPKYPKYNNRYIYPISAYNYEQYEFNNNYNQTYDKKEYSNDNNWYNNSNLNNLQNENPNNSTTFDNYDDFLNFSWGNDHKKNILIPNNSNTKKSHISQTGKKSNLYYNTDLNIQNKINQTQNIIGNNTNENNNLVSNEYSTENNENYIFDINNTNNNDYLYNKFNDTEINNNNYDYGFDNFNESYQNNANNDFWSTINDSNYQFPGEETISNPPSIPKIELDFMIRARGLANVGATCYMNATLQCFYHVKKLSENLINDNNITPSMEITYSYKNLIEELTGCKDKTNYLINKQNYTTDESLKDYYEPNDFKNIISAKNPLFKGIQANDSKDLIIFLLENMDKELTERNNKNMPFQIFNGKKVEQTYEENFKKVHNSIFAEIFYGFQKSIMQCCSCRYTDETYNIINFLIFPLEKVYNTLNQNNNNLMNNNFMYNNIYYNMNNNPSYLGMQMGNINQYPYNYNSAQNNNLKNNNISRKISLDDCFKENENIELLFGPNQIYCNKCKRNSNAKTKNELFKAPNVLILILNRGKGNSFKCDVDFPYELDISQYVKNNPSSPKNYELIGVISHLGESSMEGHFIAFCKHFDMNWRLFNDGIVNQVSQNDIFRGTPYILFYQNINFK